MRFNNNPTPQQTPEPVTPEVSEAEAAMLETMLSEEELRAADVAAAEAPVPTPTPEEVYPAHRIFVANDYYSTKSYRQADLKNLFTIGELTLVPLQDEVVPPEGAKKYKGSVAISRYLAYLNGFDTEQERLASENIKTYKSGRSKIYVLPNLNHIVNMKEKLKSYVSTKKFCLQTSSGEYDLEKAKVGTDKHRVKVGEDYLYVPKVWMPGYLIVPLKSADLSLISVDVINQLLDKKNEEIRTRQRELMKQTIELIFKNDNIDFNITKEWDQVINKYQNDERIKSIKIENDGFLIISFRGRRATDQSGNYLNVILPPNVLSINILNGRFYFPTAYRHPHTLNADTICAGQFKQFISKSLRQMSLMGIVDTMVEFACSFTASDCWASERNPRNIMKQYLGEKKFEFESDDWVSDVTYRDIFLTLRTRGNLLWAAMNVPELFAKTVGYIDFLNWDNNSGYYLASGSDLDDSYQYFDNNFYTREYENNIPRIYPKLHPTNEIKDVVEDEEEGVEDVE